MVSAENPYLNDIRNGAASSAVRTTTNVNATGQTPCTVKERNDATAHTSVNGVSGTYLQVSACAVVHRTTDTVKERCCAVYVTWS